MKQRITTLFQVLTADRYILVLLAVFLISSLALLVYLATSIHASELQVVVHYTSFGTTNFYRDKWYYLLSFAGFIILMAVLHTLITYKLLQAKGRDLTIAFIWLGITLLVISGALFYQILKVASLS
ncbi:MAG: hypothetical protein JWN75_1015 [Candidatus Saccharibacteria bacterium]|nr:hypothetical protein [Candidatus Saccharibacteria bacterium]